MYARLVATHGMFDSFVGCKVNSVGRTYYASQVELEKKRKKKTSRPKQAG
jgi:hypothetical protein